MRGWKAALERGAGWGFSVGNVARQVWKLTVGAAGQRLASSGISSMRVFQLTGVPGMAGEMRMRTGAGSVSDGGDDSRPCAVSCEGEVRCGADVSDGGAGGSGLSEGCGRGTWLRLGKS